MFSFTPSLCFQFLLKHSFVSFPWFRYSFPITRVCPRPTSCSICLRHCSQRYCCSGKFLPFSRRKECCVAENPYNFTSSCGLAKLVMQFYCHLCTLHFIQLLPRFTRIKKKSNDSALFHCLSFFYGLVTHSSCSRQLFAHRCARSAPWRWELVTGWQISPLLDVTLGSVASYSSFTPDTDLGGLK